MGGVKSSMETAAINIKSLLSFLKVLFKFTLPLYLNVVVMLMTTLSCCMHGAHFDTVLLAHT